MRAERFVQQPLRVMAKLRLHWRDTAKPNRPVQPSPTHRAHGTWPDDVRRAPAQARRRQTGPYTVGAERGGCWALMLRCCTTSRPLSAALPDRREDNDIVWTDNGSGGGGLHVRCAQQWVAGL